MASWASADGVLATKCQSLGSTVEEEVRDSVRSAALVKEGSTEPSAAEAVAVGQ